MASTQYLGSSSNVMDHELFYAFQQSLTRHNTSMTFTISAGYVLLCHYALLLIISHSVLSSICQEPIFSSDISFQARDGRALFSMKTFDIPS